MAYRFISFGYTAIEDNTGFLFWQVAHIWSMAHDKMLKKMFNINQLHYVILSNAYWLHSRNGIEVTQSFLSQYTKIEKMTISKNLQILEEQGYIFRTPHSTDSRANAVFLTEKGLDLLEEAVRMITEIDMKFFAPLGKSLRSFNKKLLTLIEHNRKNRKPLLPVNKNRELLKAENK
ncbi:MAG: MarR family winged helix-turn-helix transcriptional regulator [Prevotella sp.]|jgi:DNA-binding MarR family transcriptional regulator|nr:MarR family winged helix-turn-helix transcriptional regulator [Prevotella sp.]